MQDLGSLIVSTCPKMTPRYAQFGANLLGWIGERIAGQKSVGSHRLFVLTSHIETMRSGKGIDSFLRGIVFGGCPVGALPNNDRTEK